MDLVPLPKVPGSLSGYENEPGTFGSGTKSIVITFDDGYQDNFTRAFPIMKKFCFKATIFCIAGKIGREGYLDKDQIREMAKAGFEFGSHTITHAELPNLKQEDKKKEIVLSKANLEKELNMKIDYFCYPKGLYDQESVEFVKAAKYAGACSNEPGSNNGVMNPYFLKRTEIASHDSLFDFEKKLSGAYDFLHRILYQVRKRP